MMRGRGPGGGSCGDFLFKRHLARLSSFPGINFIRRPPKMLSLPLSISNPEKGEENKKLFDQTGWLFGTKTLQIGGTKEQKLEL